MRRIYYQVCSPCLSSAIAGPIQADPASKVLDEARRDRAMDGLPAFKLFIPFTWPRELPVRLWKKTDSGVAVNEKLSQSAAQQAFSE